MTIDTMVKPVVTMAEAQAFARVETGEEEALLAGLVRTATALAEGFCGQVMVARDFVETMPASGRWQRVSASPVRSIDRVEAVAADGTITMLAPAQYEVDIDGRGDGWVRSGVGGRMRVSGRAGLADDRNDVPEPIRQGVLRLVSHLFATRDGQDGEPPAAVTALWRPYRKMRLA